MNAQRRVDATHDVINQPPPLAPYDAYTTDRALGDVLRQHEVSAEERNRLADIGIRSGDPEVATWARNANRVGPVLITHDRYGHRVDEVEFHPDWHRLLGTGVEFGLQARPWTSTSPTAHLARSAGFYLWSQAEPGNGCPLSMTYAAVASLRQDKDLATFWQPRLTTPSYDGGLRPPSDKPACLAGMAMTEKQGGSDVRANSTAARSDGAGGYLLTGHKWFCSAPMSDVFLMLAQAPGGLSCFVVPRVLPDGRRNGIQLMRLKDKLGNRSNASAEIELVDAHARLLGEEGRGVASIIEMVSSTRLDCVLGSAALMRRATTEATWHTAYRRAFGHPLDQQPAMRAVLADLVIEQEAALVLGLRLAAAVDGGERSLLRLGLPLAKYLVCKRTPTVVAEALECLGGNGYVEDSGLPLLFRESPLNSIWEGSGNVQALDVLRALQREPEALDAWLEEIAPVRGADHRFDRAVEDVLDTLSDLADLEYRARSLTERLARVLQGALLLRCAPPAVADAFVAARLGAGGETLGTLPVGCDVTALVERVELDR